MSSYINIFLKTEVTCIPKLLQKYIGEYYDNAVWNGATWLFAIWGVLHLIFDKSIDTFLKKLRYREYVRLRLKASLWYLGFYGTALAYCGATLAQNEVELFNFKKMHVPSKFNLPSEVLLGYALISTFYLQSAFWEGLAKGSVTSMLNYLFLFAFILATYVLRIVETSFTLTALIAIAQVAIEFTRCCFTVSNQDSILSKIFLGVLYIIMFAVFIAIYIIVIPLTFIVPIGLRIMADYPNILLLFLFIDLLLWLFSAFGESVIFKLVDHWLYHKKDYENENAQECTSGLFECSLFKPRNDIPYNIKRLREEVKARETKMMSLRKPKNKNMLIQTLKCMVAIKKKLSEKRLSSDSSDSEDSEKSEDSDLKPCEHTDEDSTEQQSDQDLETEDEESQESTIAAKETEEEDEEDNNSNISNDTTKNEIGKDEKDRESLKQSKNEDIEKHDNNNKENIESELKIEAPHQEKQEVTKKDDITVVSLAGDGVQNVHATQSLPKEAEEKNNNKEKTSDADIKK